MGFEHATASSMHDLLDKLKTFLVADGWTVDNYSADSQMYETWTGLTATGSYRLHIHKTFGETGDPEGIDTGYFNFRSATRLALFQDHSTYSTERSWGRYDAEVRGIGINGGTGYAGTGVPWDQQTGVPLASGTSATGACITEIPASGTFDYWIFSNGDNVVLVCEHETGKFMWMAFGRLKKAGYYNGGLFYAASCQALNPSYSYFSNDGSKWDSSPFRECFLSHPRDIASPWPTIASTGVYLDDGESNVDWHCIGNKGSSADRAYLGCRILSVATSPYSAAYFGESGVNQAISHYVLDWSPGSLVPTTPMCPTYFLLRDTTFAYYRYLGHIEGLRQMRVDPWDGGDTFTYGDTGGETWYTFPAHMKGVDTDSGVSLNIPAYGFAVLRQD